MAGSAKALRLLQLVDSCGRSALGRNEAEPDGDLVNAGTSVVSATSGTGGMDADGTWQAAKLAALNQERSGWTVEGEIDTPGEDRLGHLGAAVVRTSTV